MPVTTRDPWSGPVSEASLREMDLDWLLEDTFLGHLEDGAGGKGRLAEVLAGCRWRAVAGGEELARREGPARGDGPARVVVAARVHVDLQVAGPDGAFVTRAEVEPGMVLGLDGLSGRPPAAGRGHGWDRAVAAGAGHVLEVPVDPVRRAMAASPDLRAFVEGQAEAARRFLELRDLLSRNPLLRPLSDDDTERLLLGAVVERHDHGRTLVEASEVPEDVFVVLSGRLLTEARGEKGAWHRRAVATRGDLAGYKHRLAEHPVDERVRALGPVEVLRLDADTLHDAVERNALVLREMLARMAVEGITETRARGSREGRVIFVGAADDALDVAALAWGLAATMASDRNLRPCVLDLGGVRRAEAAGLPTRPAKAGGLAARRIGMPGDWPVEVLAPADGTDPGELVRALRGQKGPGLRVVVACGDADTPAGIAAQEEADAVVIVRDAAERLARPRTRRRPVVFQAIRVSRGVDVPFHTAQRSVRLLPDPATVEAFWSTGDATLLTTPATRLGRACGRLARLVRGRSVGVALGGGGALGFAHVGLLRVLEKAGIPVDVVSGVSFGSVVGSLYAAGGLDTLGRLVGERQDLNRRVLMAVFGLGPVKDFIQRLSGDLRMEDTEIPFYPVGMNLTSGREFVLPGGTLGEAVQSASCMPGAWPAMELGTSRLVDGGVVNNVPVSTLWEAGADFIVASSIFTPDPGALHLPLPDAGAAAAHLLHPAAGRVAGALRALGDRIPLRDRLEDLAPRPAEWCLVKELSGRAQDMVHGLHLLMAQNGRDRAAMADFGFDFEMPGVEAYDFLAAEDIVRQATLQAEGLAGSLRAAWQEDASIRF